MTHIYRYIDIYKNNEALVLTLSVTCGPNCISLLMQGGKMKIQLFNENKEGERNIYSK